MRELQNTANMQRAPLPPTLTIYALNQMQTAEQRQQQGCHMLRSACHPFRTHTHIYANVERSIIKLDLAADLASILSLNFSHENFELKFCAGTTNKFY